MARILHLSDPHFGAADPAVEKAFLARAEKLAPDYTVLSGDLTMRARRSELAAARQFVAGLPRPLLMIPGNHDVPAANHVFDRFFNPFRRYKASFGADLEPEDISGDLHFVSVNSTRAAGLHADWSVGILSRAQLASITERFSRSPQGATRVLVLHHPLLAPPGHGRTVVNPLPALLRAIHEARVDLVLCGHFHLSQLATAGTLDGWQCVVSQASTVCSTRLKGDPQGFHEITVDGGSIRITPWKYEGGDFHPVPPFSFLRGGRGWKDCGDSRTGEVTTIG